MSASTRCAPLFFLCFAAAITGCDRGDPLAADPQTPPQDPAARRVLHVLMRSDTIDPLIPQQFEEQFGVRVAVDTYQQPAEMLARLQQGGRHPYDLLVVRDDAVPELAARGILQPLERAKVPHAQHVMERFAHPPYDPDDRVTLPYQWGTVGIIFRRDQIPDFEPTWAMLFDPSRRPGPFLIINEVRDAFGAALKSLGHSLNATDPEVLREAGETLLAATGSPHCLGVEDASAACDRVAAGDAALAMVYSGNAFKAMELEGEEQLGYAIPREGGRWWMDVMLLPAGTQDADLAYEFMNYILDPQIGGQLAEWTRCGTPNQAALPYLQPETRANQAIYPPEEIMNRLEPLRDAGDARPVYEELWAAIRATQ